MAKVLSTPFGAGIAVTVDADPTITPHAGIPRGSMVVFDDGVADPRCYHKHDDGDTDADNTVRFVLSNGDLSAGRVPFVDAKGRLADNSLFVWNGEKLGVGTAAPKKTLHCAKDGINPSVLLLENSRPNTEDSTDETVRTTFGFGGKTNAVLWVAFKEDDFTELAKESAGIEIHTRKEGSTSAVVRIAGNGNMTVLRGNLTVAAGDIAASAGEYLSGAASASGTAGRAHFMVAGGTPATPTAQTVLTLQRDQTTAHAATLLIVAGSAAFSRLSFDVSDLSHISYHHGNAQLEFSLGGFNMATWKGGTGLTLLRDDLVVVSGKTTLGGDLAHTGAKLGFYAGTPIVKQTGVAVTTAAIHAALVNLALIAA